MKIRTFETFDEAKTVAEKNGKDVTLFKLEDGQQNFEWEPIGVQLEPIDLLDFLQNERKRTIFDNEEDFINFSLEAPRDELTQGEITQDEFDKIKQEVYKVVDDFEECPDGLIVHDDVNDFTYVEPHRYVMRWHDYEHTTFVIGVII